VKDLISQRVVAHSNVASGDAGEGVVPHAVHEFMAEWAGVVFRVHLDPKPPAQQHAELRLRERLSKTVRGSYSEPGASTWAADRAKSRAISLLSAVDYLLELLCLNVIGQCPLDEWNRWSA
jgi:hypothetical protein